MAIKYQKKEDYNQLYTTLQRYGLGSLTDEELVEAYKGLSRATRQRYSRISKIEQEKKYKLRGTSDLRNRFEQGTDKYGNPKIIITTPRNTDMDWKQRSEVRKDVKSMLTFLHGTDVPSKGKSMAEELARQEVAKFKEVTGMENVGIRDIGEFWDIFHENKQMSGLKQSNPHLYDKYFKELSEMYEERKMSVEDLKSWWANQDLSPAAGIPVN